MPALPYWFWPGDERPTEEIDDEIAEELRLHLDLLAEEHQRRGLAPEEAKQKAAERFGDFDQLLRRCRREKQGDIPMLKRIQAVLVGLLVAGVLAVGWQQWAMSQRFASNQTEIKEMFTSLKHEFMSLNASIEKPALQDTGAAGGGGEFGGWSGGGDSQPKVVSTEPEKGVREQRVVVRDPTGEPIVGATVEASVHYFYMPPNENTTMSLFGVTDKQGRWSVPLSKNASLICLRVYAPGRPFVLRSFGSVDGAEELREARESEVIEITAPAPAPIELVVTREDGTAADRVTLLPEGRTDLSDRYHTPPKDLDRPLWRQTDADGRVKVDWLAVGDIVRLRVKERGRADVKITATTLEFELPSDTNGPVAINMATHKLRPIGPNGEAERIPMAKIVTDG